MFRFYLFVCFFCCFRLQTLVIVTYLNNKYSIRIESRWFSCRNRQMWFPLDGCCCCCWSCAINWKWIWGYAEMVVENCLPQQTNCYGNFLLYAKLANYIDPYSITEPHFVLFFLNMYFIFSISVVLYPHISHHLHLPSSPFHLFVEAVC